MTEAIVPIRFSNVLIVAISIYVITAFVGTVTADTKNYAIVVANNQSLDEDTTPLRFADDDAAKYYEMLIAAGVSTKLLTVLDSDAQMRYSSAQKATHIPTKDNLLKTLRAVFELINEDNKAGFSTSFMFIYSGHGNIGSNREGYINLTDAKFYRSELYKHVISESPASFNHIILDACHAYYMVNKRGKSDKTGDYSSQVRSFLSTEELSRYPNTGVILAASSESETHEWGKWESGIFSHELRSAMLGAADINLDGLITYDEAAACVEAANSSIEIPKARLKVFYHPPAMNIDTPLMDLSSFGTSKKITVSANMAGKYYVEDSRGIRIADFNFTSEQPVTLVLPGNEPFFLRSEESEAEISGELIEIDASSLQFRDVSTSHRGSIDQSFHRNLYKTPFGGGFYKGIQTIRQTESFSPTSLLKEDSSSKLRFSKVAGLSLLGAGIVLGTAGGITYYAASRSFDNYNNADSESSALKYQESAEDRLLTSRILIGTGIGVAAVSIIYLGRYLVKKNKSKERFSANAQSLEKGIFVSVTGSF